VFFEKVASSPALPAGAARRGDRRLGDTPDTRGRPCAAARALATEPGYLKFAGESCECFNHKSRGEIPVFRASPNKLRQKVLMHGPNRSFSADGESCCKSLDLKSVAFPLLLPPGFEILFNL